MWTSARGKVGIYRVCVEKCLKDVSSEKRMAIGLEYKSSKYFTLREIFLFTYSNDRFLCSYIEKRMKRFIELFSSRSKKEKKKKKSSFIFVERLIFYFDSNLTDSSEIFNHANSL